MPFYSEILTIHQIDAVHQAISLKPLSHSLRKDCADGDVTMFTARDAAGEAIVYHSASGFYFYRLAAGMGAYDGVLAEIDTPRTYLCSAFELLDDAGLEAKLRERFVEVYGARFAAQIDTLRANFGGKTLLLAKFPVGVVQQMMAESGGVLNTVFRGQAEELRRLPTLARFVELPERGAVHSVFATQYGPGQLHYVRALHYRIVQEVARGEARGVCLSEIARWDA